MRMIGLAERSLSLMCQRIVTRTTFGKKLAQHGSIVQDVARSRVEIDQARLMVLQAAYSIDTQGPKVARHAITAAKIVVPSLVLGVVDRAIQAFGAAGVSQDTPLAYFWVAARTLRIADGPDEVHMASLGRDEIKKQNKAHL